MKPSLATIALVPRGAQLPLPSPAERRELFAWAKHVGFEAVELSPRWLNFPALLSADLERIEEELHDAGLVVSGSNVNRCLVTRSDDPERLTFTVRRALEATARLGGKLFTISLSHPSLPGTSRPLLRGCDVDAAERHVALSWTATLARRASDLGVRLVIELHDDGLLDEAPLLLEFTQKLLRFDARVGVNPDLGNVVRSNARADWLGALTQLAPLTEMWHVKNYKGGAPSSLDEGDIDYVAAYDTLRRAGYDGYYSLESYYGEPRAHQVSGLAFMKACAERWQGPVAAIPIARTFSC